MRRRLFNLLAGLSMILFLATLAIWIRSYCRFDYVECSHRIGHAGDAGEGEAFVPGDLHSQIQIRCGKGYVDFEKDTAQFDEGSAHWTFSHVSGEPVSLRPIDGSLWNRLGFEIYHSPGQLESLFTMPIWPIALAAGLIPAAWILGRSRRRMPPNCCDACGYDLRATPNRCPECGLVRQSSSG